MDMRPLSVTAVQNKEAGAGRSGILKPETCGWHYQHAGGHRRQSPEKISENRETDRAH